MKQTKVFGVEYRHARMADGDDMYYTEFGVRWKDHLRPENFWKDRSWFDKNSVKLFGHQWRQGGTGTVYRVQTKKVKGTQLEIVLKWNRMGQDIPGAGEDDHLMNAAFNSPYEEFALVHELREAQEDGRHRLLTQRPLAIYVPARRMAFWQSGRNRHAMQAKMRAHIDIDLDMHRSYAVIYEWVKGLDAREAVWRGALTEEEMRELTLKARGDMERKGFLVRDHKPQHLIVRPKGNETSVLRKKDGRIPYVLVDFELLERTPAREQMIKKAKRQEYLERQAHRFDHQETPLPPHLRQVKIMDVDYIYGQAPTTNGELWVVGRDPSLFDYFLPERWERSARTKLSVIDEMYHTVTRDNIQLVWKLSRVGQKPYVDPFKPDEKRILDYGYNSPFEEFALSLELSRRGIPTTYPRAIYMTGHSSHLADSLVDESRYRSHESLRTPKGQQILREDRDYIAIWGYFNKPDELLAIEDGNYYRSMDALQAYRQGILTEPEYLLVMQRTRARLAAVGIEDLSLRGNHLLLSLNSAGHLVRGTDGHLECRISSYELLRHMK